MNIQKMRGWNEREADLLACRLSFWDLRHECDWNARCSAFRLSRKYSRLQAALAGPMNIPPPLISRHFRRRNLLTAIHISVFPFASCANTEHHHHHFPKMWQITESTEIERAKSSGFQFISCDVAALPHPLMILHVSPLGSVFARLIDSCWGFFLRLRRVARNLCLVKKENLRKQSF